MSWENYGKWHIDHIKPCSSYDFNKSEDIIECFNWKNLRPCWGKENLEKSDKIDLVLINKFKTKAETFLKSNSITKFNVETLNGSMQNIEV